MFSYKYIFLFPILISSPVHWWYSVLFPSGLCAAHHVVTVNMTKIGEKYVMSVWMQSVCVC